MTLLELVNLRIDLLNIGESILLTNEVNERIHLMNSIKLRNPTSNHPTPNKLINELLEINDKSKLMLDDITAQISQIESEIETLANELFSGQAYLDQFDSEKITIEVTDKNYRKIKRLINANFSYISSRIQRYCDWKFPGLIMNPPNLKKIDSMVVSDPLYITNSMWPNNTIRFRDSSAIEYIATCQKYNLWWPEVVASELNDILKNTSEYIPMSYKPESYGRFLSTMKLLEDPVYKMLSVYPEEYRRRVRVYPILCKDYSMLPQNQFSVVVLWDWFNYTSFREIREYFSIVKSLLRPGGVFVFSYNNCDVPAAALWAQEKRIPYTNPRMIKSLISEMRMELVHMEDIMPKNSNYPAVSWAEVRMPGELTTVKAHQAMGAINRK